ncbi:hypothetical protein TWF506_005554 [Arthrobotrys conoides]|uniref:Uncharacterized protein n=1 Tax=Arthrobotrys conoides TaxID=74498 RepID=A0AAN8S3F9_9PEZI
MVSNKKLYGKEYPTSANPWYLQVTTKEEKGYFLPQIGYIDAHGIKSFYGMR